MSDAPLDTFRAEFFRMLGHAMRIKILRLLRSGEKSVSELQEALGLDSSATSQHLTALRVKNLVVSRREGAKVFYTVRDPQIYQLLDYAREIFNKHLIDSRMMLDELEQEEQALAESASK
jgi:ArsR family transcriptional regulator